MHEGGKTEEVNVTLLLFNYIAICLIPQEILANFSIFVNYDKLLCKLYYVNQLTRVALSWLLAHILYWNIAGFYHILGNNAVYYL